MKKKQKQIIIGIILAVGIALFFHFNNPLSIASGNGVTLTRFDLTDKNYQAVTSFNMDDEIRLSLSYSVGFTGNPVNVSFWFIDLDTSNFFKDYFGREKKSWTSNPNSGVATSDGYIMPNKDLHLEFNFAVNDVVIYTTSVNISLNGTANPCINGQTRCLSSWDNRFLLTCENQYWTSNGFKVGYCGVECLNPSDCGVNTCDSYYICNMNKCEQHTNIISQKPCSQAIWNDYPTCTWDTSSCVPQPTKPTPSGFLNFIQKIKNWACSNLGLFCPDFSQETPLNQVCSAGQLTKYIELYPGTDQELLNKFESYCTALANSKGYTYSLSSHFGTATSGSTQYGDAECDVTDGTNFYTLFHVLYEIGPPRVNTQLTRPGLFATQCD